MNTGAKNKSSQATRRSDRSFSREEGGHGISSACLELRLARVGGEGRGAWGTSWASGGGDAAADAGFQYWCKEIPKVIP